MKKLSKFDRKEIEFRKGLLTIREPVYANTDLYTVETISYNLRRIAMNLRDRGYITDARHLANILASLNKRYEIKDPYE